jgi:hypothetical protein
MAAAWGAALRTNQRLFGAIGRRTCSLCYAAPLYGPSVQPIPEGTKSTETAQPDLDLTFENPIILISNRYLLLTQSDHGVDGACSAGRHVASNERRSKEDQTDAE